MSTPAIRFENVSRHFGDVKAVDEANLEIGDGEFFSMLGPSGSGKTTCLRMIAGFDRPTFGNIFLYGQDVSNLPPYERDVNTVFQDYALFPHMTIEDNIAYGLMIRGINKVERYKQVDEMLDLVRLPGFGHRKPSQLSGGQRQRVALARALLNHPKVLLLDEPLGALDLKLRQQMQIELKSIQREVGITFIYVTHDQEEALTMSDRIAVINEGRVQQVADPPTLYELPENRFVADFIGQTNVFSGTVESVNGERVTLRSASGERVEATGREVEVGQEAHASVRPEKIRFGSEGDNTSTARIRQIVYLGVSSQYIAELPNGEELVLYQQNFREEDQPEVGEEVPVAWDARNCLVLGG